MTAKEKAQISFMAAIISNADTMRELTKMWNSIPKDSRCDFEEMIVKVASYYVDAMLKYNRLHEEN
jgi:hypothetical protein